MRDRSLFAIAFCFATAVLVGSILTLHVFARRGVKDISGSSNGSSGVAGDCSDSFPTPFAAVLNGQVTPTDPNSPNPPACAGFPGAGPYPNYSLPLVASDQSFTLTVTPVLWGNGQPTDTIIHLEFSSTNPTLRLQSFVIGGLTATGSAVNPMYVVCDFAQASTATSEQFYVLQAVENSSALLVACTQPTMSPPNAPTGINGNASSIQPTPIQFADTNTVRWDIDGLQGSSTLPTTLPSVDLFVSGLPSDIVPQLVLNTPITSTNNLTSPFMADKSNFLAIAFDSSTGKTVSAGTLSIPIAAEPLTNDSISSPTTVNATAAMTAAGFTDQVNIAGATPEENSDGTPSNAPANPPDPVVPGACFGPGSSDASLFRTVWYTFNPVGDGAMTIDTANSRFDTVLAVFTGTPGNLTLVSNACDDNITDQNSITHLQARVPNVPVVHDTTYYILVGESPTQIGFLNCSSTSTTCTAGNPTTTTVAGPLSDDATLFFSVVETPTAAAVGLSPISGSALSFGNQQVGVSSPSQKITIASNGGTPLTISNISLPSGSAFAVSNTTCNSPLPQGSSCEIDLTFTATATGPVSANLTFSDNVTGSSPSFALSGNGVNFTFPTPPTITGTLTATTNATYNLSVAGSAGFGNAVSFNCSGLPANTQFSFSPNPAMPGSSTTTVVLTISRISNTAELVSRRVVLHGSVGLTMLLFLLLRNRRGKISFLMSAIVLVLVLGSAVSLVSCGGGGGTPVMTPPSPSVPPPSGSYKFTVTATSSGYSAPPVNLTLAVQ